MFSHLKRTAKRALRGAVRVAVESMHSQMRFPTYPASVRDNLRDIEDNTRYATLALALARLELDGMGGAIAELGVYKGFTAKFIHQQLPDRTLYLFDTFKGFPREALEGVHDQRFQDTSIQEVKRCIGDLRNIEFRVGYFPDSAKGLEDEKFALVMLDFDLYRSAMDALDFFYPRLNPGGYFFLHDFNNPESNFAISRAANEFLRDKPEFLLEIPDEWGTAVFRKTKIGFDENAGLELTGNSMRASI